MRKKFQDSGTFEGAALKDTLSRMLKKKEEKRPEKRCHKDFTIEHSRGLAVLRINCEGCDCASLLTDPVCRREVVARLVENPADKIEFCRRLTTNEYQKGDVQTLKEISEILMNIESAPFGIFRKECGECAQKAKRLRQIVLESLKTDPLAAYQGLDSPVDKERTHVTPECKKCAAVRMNTLSYILKALGATSLVEKSRAHSGAAPEEAYKKIFSARVRPFLSDSRITPDLPDDAQMIGNPYEIEGAKVGLYRVKSRNEDLYFIVPPEYGLDSRPEILELLMQTRDWLLANASDQISAENAPENVKEKFVALCKIKLLELAAKGRISLADKEADGLVSTLVRCTRGLDVIELLLKDPAINDVYVNSPMETTPVYVKHRDLDDCRTNIYLSEDRANNFVLKFVLKSGIGLSPNSPILEMDLEELKSRVSVIAPPLSPDGIAFSIRCKSEIPWTLPMFIKNHMISPLAAALLAAMVNDQVALLVVGGRGTGKSSFLGGLMTAMNPKYRILTLEDTLELPVPELNDMGFRVQRMLVKPITTSEGLNITADDALRSTLRMGESSIVVGEVRGQEAKVLYESIRVGATGNTVLGTIHGRSPRDVYERVVYDLGIAATSFKATDVIVVTERLPVGRRVTQIAELDKDVDIETLGSGSQANGLFEKLMCFDYEADSVELAKGFAPEKSSVLQRIAERRGTTPQKVWDDVEARARMYADVIGWYRESGIDRLLEIRATADLNKKYLSIVDECRQKDFGRYANLNYDRIYCEWLAWAKGYVQNLKDGGYQANAVD